MDEFGEAARDPQAVIINTARGPSIHEAALIEALNNGEIAIPAAELLAPRVSGQGQP